MPIALLERALLPDPRSWAPAPKDVMEWIWHVQSQDGFLEGPVFVDASASDPSGRLLSRVGVGVATVSEAGSLTAALRAAMPLFVQEPGVGDIFVAASVLQLCIPPVELVTDYAGLVEGFELGPAVTTSASRKYADDWALFWQRAADFGPEAISIRKVPAHVSRTRMLDGGVDISFRDWVGNQQADLAAKRGVSGHPSVAAVKAQLKRVTTVVTAAAKWFGVLGAHMDGLEISDVLLAESRCRPPKPRATPPLEARVLIVTPPPREEGRAPPGALGRRGGDLRGGQEALSSRAVSSRGPPKKASAPLSRDSAWLPHRSHVHWKVGVGTSFGSLCGAYSICRRSPALMEVCPKRAGTPARARQLARLMQGCHPSANKHMGAPCAV